MKNPGKRISLKEKRKEWQPNLSQYKKARAYMKKAGVILLFIMFIVLPSFAQQISGFYKIDTGTAELKKTINIWGYVQNPGRYEIPATTNLVQLIAYAGGPREYAVLDEVKVYRTLDDGKQIAREVDVEDPSKINPSDLTLNNEDTVVIDYSSTVTLRDIFSFVGAPVAMIASVILIIDRINHK